MLETHDADLEGFEIDTRTLRRVVLLACGTSYHAGLVGKFLIEGAARIPCEVDLASEFRYRDPVVGPGDLVIAISQSGETADTLAAVKEARARGCRDPGDLQRRRFGDPAARRTARCTRTPGRRSASRRPSASPRSWRRWRWWRSTSGAARGTLTPDARRASSPPSSRGIPHKMVETLEGLRRHERARAGATRTRATSCSWGAARTTPSRSRARSS